MKRMIATALLLSLAIPAAAQTPAMDLEAIRKRLDDDAMQRQWQREQELRQRQMEQQLRNAEIKDMSDWLREWQKHHDLDGWRELRDAVENPGKRPDHDFAGSSASISSFATGTLANMPDREPIKEEKRQKMLREIATPIAVFTMFGLIMMVGIFCVLGGESLTRWAARVRARRHEFKRGLLG